MATLQSLRALILQALARDDEMAITLANAAINYAILMASLNFEPPEMFNRADVILTGGSNTLYFPNLITDVDIDEGSYVGAFEIDPNGDLMPIAGSTLATNLLDVIKIFDKTNQIKLNFIPFEMWDSLVPSSVVGAKYWSLFGHSLFIKTAPINSILLTISYSRYPSPLINNNDEVPFSYHDSYIVATATGICWAAIEETESADLWVKISGLVGASNALGTRARSVVEGQRVLLESVINESRR